MKTTFKILTCLAIAAVFGTAALAADPPTPQSFTPGWRHEQMIQAQKDGNFGPGMMMRAGYGPGQGRGRMAAALGPDGKIDPTKLPEGCPFRDQAATPAK
ncbi:hypothetical protein CU669_15390 [Paramagnetospirillum kuznetsovii]|uniref:Uncharacterized protein n=1 Tax=Paramagnetospirillum kuznetsovii TaxID=2053833 RepID=A0A364NVK5_9PROT|nr:hypothetical protein [Paramagnetospirillum kuznetsovii]RAU21030.1 hypothetical protein CU669_15390 [Paramagnetospirillum kuznetsovii]